jgi:hypothetical protein
MDALAAALNDQSGAKPRILLVRVNARPFARRMPGTRMASRT